MSLVLVLGGARSGKTGYAEQLAAATHKHIKYVATAQVRDDEIAQRVKQHQSDRPSDWETVESPISLAETIQLHSTDNTTLLVDCLTMWVTNLMCADDPAGLDHQVTSFVQALSDCRGDVIVVSNEVSHGVTPMGEMSRQFVDIIGKLHQEVAAASDHTVMVIAGLPLALKGNLTNLNKY